MQVTIRANVIGAKKFSDTIDGKMIDFCKINATTQMDESKGNAIGWAGTEYDFGSSVNFDRFKGAKFPFEADLICEVVVQGRGQKFKVLEVKPVQKA